MTEFFGKRWHDMGGDPAGTINPDEHDFALWEKRVDALMVLTSAAGLMTTDSLRRVLEDMGPDAYETMTYYERWIASITQNMVEAGAITTEELGIKMADVRARGTTYGVQDRKWRDQGDDGHRDAPSGDGQRACAIYLGQYSRCAFCWT